MAEEEFRKPQLMVVDAPVSKPPEKPSAPSNSQPFKYEEPSWSAMPPSDKKYQLEVIKGGTVIEPIDLSKRPFYVVGRMPDCHISLQHPSLSRYHAILQYCDAKLGRDPSLRDGWYIQDLGSSNGTVVNKKRLEPMKYRPLEIGHVIKFGMSTRILVLQGQQDKKEEEEEGLKERKPIQQRKIQIPAPPKPKVAPPSAKPTEEAEGCMWGIAMDDEAVYESADVDPNFEEDSASSSEGEGDEESRKKRKPLDLSDPKKTLRVFFEREGLGLPEYQVENIGKNKHRAFLEIPTESGTGKAVRVEGEGGNKKEAVAACAREACITLDKMGLLRPRNKTSRKQDKKDWAANDYYDEDEDSFYDRTGDLEQKRIQRMIREKAEKGSSKPGSSGVHTEQSLQVDLDRLEAEVRQISTRLEEDERKRAEFAASRGGGGGGSGELDALDAYMSALKQGAAMDATTRVRLKHRLLEAQKERSRCERLLSIAKGPKLPASLMANAWQQQAPAGEKKEPVASSIGTVPRPMAPTKFVSNLPKLGAFEGDEDEDELGAGKPKMKKLDTFLKEEDEEGEKAKAKAKEEPHIEVTAEKMEDQDEEEQKEEEDETNKRIYSVFLPPELKQSLDEHADEVDQIWDVDRAARLAKKSESDDQTV